MARSGRWVLWLALTGVAGLLLLIAAERFGRREFVGPGLLLLAAGVFAAGADAIIRRHTIERDRLSRVTVTFTGTAARLIGLALVILAGSLAAVGAAFVIGVEHQLYQLARARPGLVLVPLGAMATTMGAASVLGAREWRGSFWRLLVSVPERFGALLLLFLGLALLAAGVVELVSPMAFNETLDSIFAPFGGPPWG